MCQQGPVKRTKRYLDKIVNDPQRLVKFFWIAPACLGEIGPTSSGPSHSGGYLFDQIVGLETARQIRGHAQDQRNLVLRSTSEKNDPGANLRFQLINKILSPKEEDPGFPGERIFPGGNPRFSPVPSGSEVIGPLWKKVRQGSI